MRLPLYKYAEKFLYVEHDTPFRLLNKYIDRDTQKEVTIDLRYLQPIFNVDAKYPEASRNVVYNWARQTGKSTSSVGLGILEQVLIPGYKLLFIQPTGDQVSNISNTRYKKMIEASPILNKVFKPSGMNYTWQVKHRQLKNGSEAFFRSCYTSADRIRGYSASMVLIDELQDIPLRAIPIILSTQDYARPDLKRNIFSGTPKYESGILTTMFNNTCAMEPHTQCQSCKHWNYLDRKIIGKNSYICTKCGKPIYPQNYDHTKFFPMNPSKLDVQWGYRIPQFMSPMQPFRAIKAKLEDPFYTLDDFDNEICALPSKEGNAIFTKKGMQAVCYKDGFLTYDEIKKKYGNIPLYMSVDYGSGEFKQFRSGKVLFKGFTVIIIGGWVKGKLVIFYMEKLSGEKARESEQPEYINKIGRRYRIKLCASDWGYGAAINRILKDKYNWRKTYGGSGDGPVLYEFQNMNTHSIKEVIWNQDASHGDGRFMINKNWLIGNLIHYMLHLKKIILPKWEWISNKPRPKFSFVDDFLGINRKIEDGRTSYYHSQPDDTPLSMSLLLLVALHDIHDIALPNHDDLRSVLNPESLKNKELEKALNDRQASIYNELQFSDLI